MNGNPTHTCKCCKLFTHLHICINYANQRPPPCFCAVMRDEFREHPPPSIDVPLSAEAAIPCRPPRGKPDPRVRWMKDGDPVPKSTRMSVEESGILRIEDTRREDTGVYVCVAYNVAGERESIPCQLTVKGTRVCRLFTVDIS